MGTQKHTTDSQGSAHTNMKSYMNLSEKGEFEI